MDRNGRVWRQLSILVRRRWARDRRAVRARDSAFALTELRLLLAGDTRHGALDLLELLENICCNDTKLALSQAYGYMLQGRLSNDRIVMILLKIILGQIRHTPIRVVNM